MTSTKTIRQIRCRDLRAHVFAYCIYVICENGFNNCQQIFIHYKIPGGVFDLPTLPIQGDTIIVTLILISFALRTLPILIQMLGLGSTSIIRSKQFQVFGYIAVCYNPGGHWGSGSMIIMLKGVRRMCHSLAPLIAHCVSIETVYLTTINPFLMCSLPTYMVNPIMSLQVMSPYQMV